MPKTPKGPGSKDTDDLELVEASDSPKNPFVTSRAPPLPGRIDVKGKSRKPKGVLVHPAPDELPQKDDNSWTCPTASCSYVNSTDLNMCKKCHHPKHAQRSEADMRAMRAKRAGTHHESEWGASGGRSGRGAKSKGASDGDGDGDRPKKSKRNANVGGDSPNIDWKSMKPADARKMRKKMFDAKKQAKQDAKKAAALEAYKMKIEAARRMVPPGCIKSTFHYWWLRWTVRKFSKSQVLDYFLNPDDPCYKGAKLLNLGHADLCKFKARFDLVDISGDNEIDYHEFMEFIWDKYSSLPPYDTPYVRALFTLFDKDRSGYIDFGEFVEASISYGTYSQQDVLQFAFATLDADGSGMLDEAEFKMLIETLTPTHYAKGDKSKGIFPGNFKRMLQEYDLNEDGMLDFHEFRMMERTYPSILYPLFKVQDLVQTSTIGRQRYCNVMAEQQISAKLRQYMHTHKNTFPPCVGTWNKIKYQITGKHHLGKYAEPGKVYDPATHVLKPKTLISEV
jgi:Ca2+-binding EF-hand superfamily protein